MTVALHHIIKKEEMIQTFWHVATLRAENNRLHFKFQSFLAKLMKKKTAKLMKKAYRK